MISLSGFMPAAASASRSITWGIDPKPLTATRLFLRSVSRLRSGAIEPSLSISLMLRKRNSTPGPSGVRVKIAKLEIFDDCEVAIHMETGQW